MSIPDHARSNLQTLLRAAADGNLALMECADAATGQSRYVVCAVAWDGTDYVFTPFGHLADGNPYDAYLPPDPDDPDRFLRRQEPEGET
jgi:hypothetical protein